MVVIKILLAIFTFLVSFFPASQALAQNSWTISSFKSELVILPSGALSVTETITTEFSESKHGIYRDIPYVYSTSSGDKKYTTIEDISVERDGTNEHYEKSVNESYIRLKIGDAERTLDGMHSYTIRYTVSGVIVSYSAYDELYWNVTGNNWKCQYSKLRHRYYFLHQESFKLRAMMVQLGHLIDVEMKK